LVTTGASERNTKIIKFYFYGLLTYKKKYEWNTRFDENFTISESWIKLSYLTQPCSS
jgi:hypothetical protein